MILRPDLLRLVKRCEVFSLNPPPSETSHCRRLTGCAGLQRCCGRNSAGGVSLERRQHRQGGPEYGQSRVRRNLRLPSGKHSIASILSFRLSRTDSRNSRTAKSKAVGPPRNARIDAERHQAPPALVRQLQREDGPSLRRPHGGLGGRSLVRPLVARRQPFPAGTA